MKVHVLTLFPRLFEAFLDESIVGNARRAGQLDVELVDYRGFTADAHRTVDDRPFGGGPGMLIKPEPVFAAVESVLTASGRPDMPKILFTPQGAPFDNERALWLAEQPRVRRLDAPVASYAPEDLPDRTRIDCFGDHVAFDVDAWHRAHGLSPGDG